MHRTYHVVAPITIDGREYRPGDVAAVTDAELEPLDDAGRAALCLPPRITHAPAAGAQDGAPSGTDAGAGRRAKG